jgi:hypothetical protein
MTEFEKNCYGITEDQIRDRYMNSPSAKRSGLEMVVMSALSDSQELINMGDNEYAIKRINIAKFIISEMMDARQEA